MCVCMNMYVCVFVCMYVYVYMYVYVCVCFVQSTVRPSATSTSQTPTGRLEGAGPERRAAKCPSRVRLTTWRWLAGRYESVFVEGRGLVWGVVLFLVGGGGSCLDPGGVFRSREEGI